MDCKIKKIKMKNKVTADYIKRLMNLNEKSIFKYKDPVSYIKNNYDHLLNNISQENFCLVIDTLYQYEELKDFMNEKFLLNMSKAKGKDIERICEIYLRNKTEEEKEQFLKEKLPQLIDQIDEDNIYNYLELKKQDPRIREKLNQKIKENKREYIEDYIFGRVNKDYAYLDDDMTYLSEKLIGEILENEHLDWIDIDYIISAGFSSVFEIGSKILKVGEERGTYRIPYDKRILQPLVRINLSDLSHDNRGTIEVCEKVLTVGYISEEELYKIYKELRERGKIWTDIKVDNIGILLKENKRHWNKNLGASKRAIGYIEEEFFNDDEEKLQAGEYVIIDSDFIYYENDPYIEWTSPLAFNFEERYQQEENKTK